MATPTKPANQVAPTNKTLAPTFMQGIASRGLEGIDSTDVEIPRVKLLQSTSEEVTLHDAAAPGLFWHSLADTVLGGNGKPVAMTVLVVSKRALLWRPMDDGGGILARSDDLVTWNPSNAKFSVKIKNIKEPQIYETKGSVAESRLLEWGTSVPSDPESQPAATLMYAMLCAFPNYPELGPAVVTLQRSAMKPGRKLLGKLKIANAPNFGLVYKMDSKEEPNAAGQKYFNYTFTSDGFVTDQALFDYYREVHNQYVGGFKFKEEPDDDDTKPVNGAGADAAEARTAGKI